MRNIIVNGGIAAGWHTSGGALLPLAAIIAWTAVAILGTGYVVLPLVAVGTIGLFATLLVLSALSAIVKAAVFYYATSGRTQKNSIQSYFVPVSQPKRLVVCLAPHDLSLITISQCTCANRFDMLSSMKPTTAALRAITGVYFSECP